MTYTQFLGWITQDVSSFWGDSFRVARLRWWPATSVEIITGQTRHSRCGGGQLVAANEGPFYCSLDSQGTVFLPLVGLKEIIFPHSAFYDEDFALSYAIAHEWGHHVQRLLGILNTPKLTSRQIELQADCLAGIWAYSVWSRDLVQPGDVAEAIRLTHLIGDAPGTSATAGDAHGSGSERAHAFSAGYAHGDPRACIAK